MADLSAQNSAGNATSLPASATLPSQSQRLPTWLCTGYGIGMIGGQIFRDAPALLLLPFLTDALGVMPVIAGLAIFIPKIWVVFADPLAGIASDRISTRWGRRRPFMFVGALLTVLLLLVMFNVPVFGSAAATATYVSAAYTLALTAFAAYSVPYLTMGSEMTTDPHDRTRLMAFRVAFMATGLIVGGYAAAIRDLGGVGREAYSFMALVMGGICLVTMMVPVFATAKAPYYDRHETSLSLFEQFKLALSNKPFLTLLSAAFLQRLAEGTGYAAIIYFQTLVLKQPPTVLGTSILFIALAGIFSQPLWVAACKHFGKKPVYVATLLLYCGAFALWLIPNPALWLIYLIGTLNGLFNSAFILTALSMLTDTVAYDRFKTGLNREGAFNGVWLASEKVAFAFGTLIVGALLSAFGYIESSTGVAMEQPESALTGITISYVIVPIVVHLSSLIFLSRYKLSEQDLKA
ncbi:MAG: MFS transporter [Rhodospirillaceae bacterium]|nr:MFS transporter [Rhodospirillaceae bacterium]